MKKFRKEFREFALRGSMIDLAVGVIIGGAFSGLVGSLVANVIMPIVGIFIGGIDISTWVVKLPTLYGGTIDWTIGVFLMAVINFIILALVVFMLVRAINKMRAKKEEAPAAPPAPPEPSNEEKLLAEIRDLLKKQ